MKKYCFLLVLWIVSPVLLFAQDDDEKKEDKKRNPNEIQTLAGDVRHNGFHWGFTFTGTDIGNQNEPALLLGGRIAWTINRIIGLGFEAKGLIPSVTMDNISVGKVRPLMGYGGFFIEPVLFSNKLIHATIPLATGSGWAGCVRDWNNDNFDFDDSDVIDQYIFWYFEPEANVEVNVTRYFRIATGVSYRYLPDFDLLNTSNKDFNGLNYNVTLKFGRF